jgi:hypothetical protein
MTERGVGPLNVQNILLQNGSFENMKDKAII